MYNRDIVIHTDVGLHYDVMIYDTPIIIRNCHQHVDRAKNDVSAFVSRFQWFNCG